jgi:hypothetical protein
LDAGTQRRDGDGLRHRVNALFSTPIRPQADFFSGKRNGITLPYSSGRIHFVALLLKPTGTKNSMITAINHPTLVKTGLGQKSSRFDKSLQMLSSPSSGGVEIFFRSIGKSARFLLGIPVPSRKQWAKLAQNKGAVRSVHPLSPE